MQQMDELHINRRSFIRTATKLGVLGTLASSPLGSWAANREVRLVVLHTNDWHSRIESFPKDGGTNAGMGGAATRAALIQQIRQNNEWVLLLDAGDIFQGTPYFNFYGGELEYKLMTQMGYDVATLGNHDFDNGIDGLLKQQPHAGFQLVNCNYDFGSTPLKSLVKPFTTIRKGPLKIGILGVGIELNGLVPEAMFKGIQYRDPLTHANEVAYTLKKDEKCDLIICLSHLGYKYAGNKISDIQLAQKSEHIDLIIGGHTHTFLNQPDLIPNKVGKEVMVNQVGWAGLQLGRIDFTFKPYKNQGFTAISEVIDIGI